MELLSEEVAGFKSDEVSVETPENSNVIPFPREWQASCDELPIWWTAKQVANYVTSHRKSVEAKKKRLAEEPGDPLAIDDYLARRVTEYLGGKWEGTRGRAPGPGHSRDDDSLIIYPHPSDPDDVMFHSHCGDDWRPIKDDLRARGILPDKRQSNGANGQDGVTKTFVCSYDYVDEGGKLLFQVCRYLKSNGEKTFLQRQPNGTGWNWSTKGLRVVLYRLPEVIKAIAAKRVVFIPEGEKDCDNLAKLGLTATCNAGGAAKSGQRPKWKKEHAAFLGGADVVVLCDNDDPGHAHGEAICASLQGIAARVRIIRALPGVDKGGDVSDWLGSKIGGDAPRLMALAESAPDWQRTDAKSPKPKTKAAHKSHGRGEFYCPARDGELSPIMDLLDEALLTDEAIPPMRSLLGHPVEVELREPAGFHELTSAGSNDDEAEESRLPPPKSYVIARHTAHTLALTIERYVRFYIINKNKEVVYKRLPCPFVSHYLDHKESKLPRVGGLMTMPLVLPNGDLLAEHGLNRELKTVFCIETEIIQLLPEMVTADDIAAAMRFLTDEWLADVPTDYAGKCTLLALALSVIERHLFGERPAFFVTAGKRGTGKTTVINMIALAILGRRAAAAAWSPEEEERRKSIFAALLQGLELIVWDNIKLGSAISCPTVEKTLTSIELEDRVLGESRRERAPCTAIQVFNGNNISSRGDLASRTLTVRLTTDRPDPENREFKHSDPFEWTLAHRGAIIRALYTILLGNPRFKQRPKDREAKKTRFKDWWHLVGAPIEHAAALAKPDEAIDFGKLFLATEGDDEESQTLADALAAIKRQMMGEFAVEFMASDIAKWMTFAKNPDTYPIEAADAGTLASYFAQAGRDKPSTKHVGYKLKSMLESPVLDEVSKKILMLKVAREKKSAGGITRWTIIEREAA